MKNGGLILWNAIAVCEMSKTSWQIGNHLANGDLDNHFRRPGQTFLAQWLKIIRSLRMTNQGFHQFGQKVLLGMFRRIRIDRGENLERRDFGRRH